MKTNLIFIIIFYICQSCNPTLPDENLTFQQTTYIGKEIRLDGCFISDPDESGKYCEYDFYYSNGVVFGFGDLLNINSIDNFTTNINNIKKYKDFWGLFQVENHYLKVQRWKNEAGTTRFIIQNLSYTIINDTTLSCDLLNDGDIRYYHYKHFLPKPDSTNVFIK